jgi:putative photosynthetic complex assembly protein
VNAKRPAPGSPPKILLAAAVVLILGLLWLVVSPPPGGGRGAVQPVASRDLHFLDQPDGGVLVADGRDGSMVARIAPGEDGFVRGALRGMGRERRLSGLGREAPFRLVAWSDGRLTLEDQATGTRVDLAAYGQTNAEAFVRFLPTMENPR